MIFVHMQKLLFVHHNNHKLESERKGILFIIRELNRPGLQMVKPGLTRKQEAC